MLAQDTRSANTVHLSGWVLLAVLLMATIALVGVALSVTTTGHSGSYGWGWMMGGGWGAMWVLGALMMMIPVFLLVLLFAFLLRSTSQARFQCPRLS